MKEQKSIYVVGGGYVGTVTATCLSKAGCRVGLIENDSKKSVLLRDGTVPFFEPGLQTGFREELRDHHLEVFDSLKAATASFLPDVVFLAVGTPKRSTGECDLEAVLDAARQVAQYVSKEVLLVLKSTVPVGTAQMIRDEIVKFGKASQISIVSNPEFLREGTAMNDFLFPERIVIGTRSEPAIQMMKEVYAPFVKQPEQFLVMSHESAELSKYAANLMLASRITLVNQVARLAHSFGADMKEIQSVLKTDSRIGPQYLDSGLGYGGSCFSKDLQALVQMSEERGVDAQLIEAVERFNDEQKQFFVPRILKRLPPPKVVAVLGLSFKPETDDLRNAASLKMVPALLDQGYELRVHDPQALLKFGEFISSHKKSKACILSKSIEETVRGADALLLLTEWNDYRNLNPETVRSWMKGNFVFDGRNVFDLTAWGNCGFQVYGVGREGGPRG